MDKPWLDAYPPGVPAEIDPDQYASLAALLEASFARFAELSAFTNLGTQMSFAAIDQSSRETQSIPISTAHTFSSMTSSQRPWE